MGRLPSNGSKCVACGRIMKRDDGVPFRTETIWRKCVAKHLNYSASFILNLDKNSRMCVDHFPAGHFDQFRKPIKVPTLRLQRVEGWNETWEPNFVDDTLVDEQSYMQFDTRQSQQQANEGAENIELDSFDMEIEEDELTVENQNVCQPDFSIVEIAQLFLLFKFCFTCGTAVNQDTVNIRHYAGNSYVRFHCRTCKKQMKWSSQTSTISNCYSGALKSVTAAFVAGISFSVNMSTLNKITLSNFSHLTTSFEQ